MSILEFLAMLIGCVVFAVIVGIACGELVSPHDEEL